MKGHIPGHSTVSGNGAALTVPPMPETPDGEALPAVPSAALPQTATPVEAEIMALLSASGVVLVPVTLDSAADIVRQLIEGYKKGELTARAQEQRIAGLRAVIKSEL